MFGHDTSDAKLCNVPRRHTDIFIKKFFTQVQAC